MTVQTSTNVANFLGNGATTYPIGFKFNSAADLVVQKTVIATGVTTTLTLNSDYSVAGAGIEEGGSITLSQAPTSSESIKVTRVVDLLQLTDLRNQGKFYAEVHEEVFDKLVMIDQQQQTEMDDANAKSGDAVATANLANEKSDQAVAKAEQNLIDMQAQYDAFEQGAAFVVIGDYAAGLVVDGYNKVFRKDGELYRAMSETTLPYQLNGDWSVDAPKFVSVGDAVLRNQLADAIDAASGAALVGYKGGALREWLLASEAAATHFMRDLDGVSGAGDNTSQLQTACALGTPVYFEPGNYLISGAEFLPSAGTTFVGAGMGQTTLTFQVPDTVTRHLFRLQQQRAVFRGMTIVVQGPTGASVQVFTPETTDIEIDHVEVAGGNTAANANLVNFLYFGNVNISQLKVHHCNVHNVQRVQLRPNASTGTASQLTYTNNRFTNLGQGGLQFNWPLGTIDHVIVANNLFRDFHAGTEQIFCGGASLRNATFSGNVFLGLANECMHFEEGGDNITVTGNVFAAQAHGLVLGDNNVSGTYKTPSRITVTGNAFLDGTLSRQKEGIRAPNNGAGIDSYSGLVVEGNVFRGYLRAMNLSTGAQSVRNNYIANCDVGVRSEKLGPWLAGNTFENVATAISGVNGAGLVGKNHFVAPIIFAASEDGSRVSMAGFTLDLTASVTLPGATATLVSTTVPLAAGNRMWGSMRGVMGSSTTRYRHRGSEITWDGTTLTDTEKVAVGSGDIAFTGFVVDGSVLKARFNNTGSAQTLTHLAVEFDGIWTSAA